MPNESSKARDQKKRIRVSVEDGPTVVVEADDEYTAWKEYCRLTGVTATTRKMTFSQAD